MKLAVIDNVNGSFTIQSEWTDNEQGAKVAFHDRCKVLWNAADVLKATVKIVDDQLDDFEDYKEFITHPAPEPEPTEHTQETQENEGA